MNGPKHEDIQMLLGIFSNWNEFQTHIIAIRSGHVFECAIST